MDEGKDELDEGKDELDDGKDELDDEKDELDCDGRYEPPPPVMALDASLCCWLEKFGKSS